MGIVIFSDNQFFGINRIVGEKTQVWAERFHDTEAIFGVTDTVHKCGKCEKGNHARCLTHC